ncbi:hypothetical protein [Williamsia phyllosphaerae]|uniref:Uncharacterized protein n=1 Tax=Williamsia phyllosphaerae TaxID=885042 RepID=A0ABQ1V0G4_9NOCA|nr:hypothetical protein [Williamsia phyllosphaerae]GGF29986.1 hypothetical protein GCM10007298_27420 [Williamsia phyllosphaerae]
MTVGHGEGDGVTGSPKFSIARLAILAMGAGALVLGVSVPVIYGVSRVSAPAALVVALLAVALAIAVMGIVANRVVDRAVDAESAEARGADTETTAGGDDTSRPKPATGDER